MPAGKLTLVRMAVEAVSGPFYLHMSMRMLAHRRQGAETGSFGDQESWLKKERQIGFAMVTMDCCMNRQCPSQHADPWMSKRRRKGEDEETRWVVRVSVSGDRCRGVRVERMGIFRRAKRTRPGRWSLGASRRGGGGGGARARARAQLATRASFKRKCWK